MTPRKIMLLGEIGVGKSSIARRLVFDRFESEYKPTLGVDIYTYEINSTAPACQRAAFIIWDTDGNLGDSILSHVYIKEAAAALIVGDVTRPATLDAMVQLGQQFMTAMPGRYCSFLINKFDLADGSDDVPSSLARSSVPTLRTSAKTGENVKTAFLGAADAIRRRGL
jgi:small GTP-binding protein